MFLKVRSRNYLTAINCQMSLNSSLPVVVKVLNQPAVKEAGCSVFVLAQFLNNRKSLGEGDGGFTTCKHGKCVLKSFSRCQRYCTTLHWRNTATSFNRQLSCCCCALNLFCPHTANLWSLFLTAISVDFLHKYPHCSESALRLLWPVIDFLLSCRRLLYTCSAPQELWDPACSVCGDMALPLPSSLCGYHSQVSMSAGANK